MDFFWGRYRLWPSLLAVMVCGRHGIELQAVNSTNNNHAALSDIFSLY